MKKIVLMMACLSISSCALAGETADWNINVAIKNLMQFPIKQLYISAAGGITPYKNINIIPGETHSVIMPSTLQDGKFYENRITLGTWRGGYYPYISDVTVRWSAAEDPNCTEKEAQGLFCKKTTSKAWTRGLGAGRESWIHFVVLPGGNIVQVSQLQYDGAIRFLSGSTYYLLDKTGKLINEATQEEVVHPAGTYLKINDDGSLTWTAEKQPYNI